MVNLKYYEYEKHEFLRQTEQGVGVNCGVHKMYVFFLSSSRVSLISKGFTIIRGAVWEKCLKGEAKQYHVSSVCSAACENVYMHRTDIVVLMAAIHWNTIFKNQLFAVENKKENNTMEMQLHSINVNEFMCNLSVQGPKALN